MDHFLVVNENKDSQRLKVADRYRLFSSIEKALEHAKSIGFESFFGFGINTAPGIANLYMCGDVKVSIIGIEEQV